VVELKHEQAMKEVRIRGLIPYYSSGSIYHIEGKCGDLEEEAIRFPKGAHDDVLDSAAYQVQIAQPPALTNPVATPAAKPYYENWN
jgi:phage terminase large subunit-like protein